MGAPVLNQRLEKYFRGRAVTGPWQLAGGSRQNYNAAIVIPALAEADTLPETLASLRKNPISALQQTRVIVVINNCSACPDSLLLENQHTLNWLQTDPFPELHLAWVDASSAGLELPKGEGVGLARKIGFDLALAQLDWSREPLLISLDADTLVDEHYLPAILHHFSRGRCGGATVPFRHQAAADPQQEAAIRHYELYLRSYLFGLQQAGSPYAYHTIGSAFACAAAAYVAVGGMNRRQAGEDFYFLQQLAKHSGVEMLEGTLVQPSPRFSSRVTFGTGKAVQAQVEQGRQLFNFFSAEAFSVLRSWLELMEQSLDSTADTILQQAAAVSDKLQAFLVDLNFAEAWRRLQINHTDGEQRWQAFHGWFDGLRTRQLLTRLDDSGERSVALVITELLAWGGYPGVTQHSEQLQLLELLQGVT